ncbi:MAG TPA: carbon-nitrogen hydrolase family protein [Bryobacteraceae bacterium]|nr:carbon-nitrogen hydrolase family protein [Bryobacteraceae bacterium]
MRIWAVSILSFSAAFVLLPLRGAELRPRSTLDQPPRKVIVGTAMQAFWGEYPGLEKRLDQLSGLIDQMAVESQKKYGRGLDLAILPEMAVTGELSGDVAAHSVPLAGPLRETFARKAREHHCYVIAPTYLLDNKEKKQCSNAAILFDREGNPAGIYRKVHLAVQSGSDALEDGTTPGKQEPVFQCDFGRLGIQICFDMEYDYGWLELARKGAELVAWPTQSPQTAHPAFRAMQNRYYIVSSTWRDNASFFEPTGKVVAQIRSPGRVLVEQLDLSYAILPWSSKLKNGKALQDKYGDKVGFRYYQDEDCGMFWSNDEHVTIGRMVRSLGLDEAADELGRIRKLYDRAGVPDDRER